jgi:hypothetical protein
LTDLARPEAIVLIIGSGLKQKPMADQFFEVLMNKIRALTARRLRKKLPELYLEKDIT